MTQKRSIFDNLSKKVKKTKLGKLVTGYQQLREANYISSHFSTFLQPVLAIDEDLRESVFKIRHNVYCEELGFEPVKENGLEVDDFDKFSRHCLIRHINSDQLAGTVRIVRPLESHEQLPIEKYCLSSISRQDLNPYHFDRKNVCEISRLAVPSYFRRRQMDRFAGAATGVINQQTYSETELRCFPFIAVGLYFAAAATALESNIEHAYVMMEPRLARSMSFVGIKFEQIGPVVDYHGRRAPYYINQDLLQKNLKPGFAKMLTTIRQSIRDQLPASDITP
ncbi:PEP-CTERM/exosortase system-associated acyltransferase [Alteromonas pelagimontana]|uniref:PEP-CTERM/exosortase system-associated acyltransferase n=1 Tax=Alteromonas pelagimontana TaxID=1858656 RepID=A0A6M4MGC3_9ALTE|nr:PEP-CTERM/exosortase system-associated acyltransferase [Alteromonas pelagimontana]QJR81997.1 PEP-CTERM/exosortase system-associated acyltransferase [Alteromonas pelagimontana]